MTSIEKPAAKALYAIVKETLTIYLDGHVYVRLEIEAQNRSDNKIAVTEPYTIPMKQASDVKAFDSDENPLIAHFNRERKVIEVFFKPNTILRPKKILKWTVLYIAPAFGIKDKNNEFCGVLSITPKQEYKGVPILVHEIRLQVHFEKPKPELWRVFKRITVELEDNQRVHLRNQEKKRERTELHFDPFYLGGERSTLRLIFKYRYGLDVNPKAILKFMASVLPTTLEIAKSSGKYIPKYIPLLFMMILEIIRRWFHR